MAKAIGIDLGTTNSVVAFKDTAVRIISTGANNEELCRSCVASKNGTFDVGNHVYNQWRRYAPNIVVSVKRLMGGAISDEQVKKMKADKDAYPYGIKQLTGGTEESVAVVLEGREYTPEQISAEILKRLKEDASRKLNDEVTHAVITVPAYFSQKQKAATRKAAELAGLKVQRLLAEPSAAAISYGMDQYGPDDVKTFLVYDFGGGTFDISILMTANGQFNEMAAGGDRWLGGDDVDRKLTDYVYTQIEIQQGIDLRNILEALPDRSRHAFVGHMKKEVENAKKALSINTEATVCSYGDLETEDGDPIDFEITITRETFNSMVRPLVARSIELIDELLEKAAFPIESIDNILLVGGSSCIPLVKEMLSAKYGAEKVKSSEKPMLSIAEGAAILAHSLPMEDTVSAPEEESPALVEPDATGLIFNTTKRAVYMEVEEADGSKAYEKIVDVSEALPLSVNRKFYTTSDNQKVLEVKLYTPAEDGSYEFVNSGFFTISENLPKGSGVIFTFTVDLDEVVDLMVKPDATGKSTRIVLGRGNFDTACLNELSQSIQSVLADPNLEVDQKKKFMEYVQTCVDKLNSKRRDDMDEEWKTIRSEIVSSKPIMVARDVNQTYLVISQILTEVFGKFVRNSDSMRMEELRNTYESTHNPAVLASLKEVCEEYSLFTHIYLYAILGERSQNPAVANKAKSLFSEIMGYLNANNAQGLKSTLEMNDDWLAMNLASLGGSAWDGPGTSVGRG